MLLTLPELLILKPSKNGLWILICQLNPSAVEVISVIFGTTLNITLATKLPQEVRDAIAKSFPFVSESLQAD